MSKPTTVDPTPRTDELLTMPEHYPLGISKDDRVPHWVLELAGLCRQFERERNRLRREIEILRQYGNKDCTAMADERIQNGDGDY